MAETMTFDLVSPEKRLLEGEAASVQVPGAEGDMTVMPNHAPVITTLRPGILSVELSGGTQEFAVTGGFAEISSSGISVLAENAYPRGSESRADLEAHLEEARQAHEEAQEDNRAAAAKAIADLEQLLEDMV